MRDQNNNITLLADIGGTFCRFSIIHGDQPDLKDYKKIKCDDFDCLEDAIDWYLQEIKQQDIENIFFAIAAPIQGEIIKIVNNHWVVDKEKLSKNFSLNRLRVINDFESIAYAVNDLNDLDIELIGRKPFILPKKNDCSIGIVGPGTGLGASAVKKSKGAVFVSALELGHVGFSPQNELQRELTAILEKKHIRVINETFVSGPGIENIFEALLELNGKETYSRSSEDIFLNLNHCEFSNQSVDLFFEILGQVAGDFALSTGTFDGILLTGDIINNNFDSFMSSQFISGFNSKLDYSELMKNIPLAICIKPEMGLLGIFELFKKSLSFNYTQPE
tara:strand:+ start:1318 stop:2316 length:999 start_codon:yes stop_codon:yes gene_type:complete